MSGTSGFAGYLTVGDRGKLRGYLTVPNRRARLSGYLVAENRRGRLAGGSQGTVAPMRVASSLGAIVQDTDSSGSTAGEDLAIMGGTLLAILLWRGGGALLAYRAAKRATKKRSVRLLATAGGWWTGGLLGNLTFMGFRASGLFNGRARS